MNDQERDLERARAERAELVRRRLVSVAEDLQRSVDRMSARLGLKDCKGVQGG